MNIIDPKPVYRYQGYTVHHVRDDDRVATGWVYCTNGSAGFCLNLAEATIAESVRRAVDEMLQHETARND